MPLWYMLHDLMQKMCLQPSPGTLALSMKQFILHEFCKEEKKSADRYNHPRVLIFLDVDWKGRPWMEFQKSSSMSTKDAAWLLRHWRQPSTRGTFIPEHHCKMKPHYLRLSCPVSISNWSVWKIKRISPWNEKIIPLETSILTMTKCVDRDCKHLVNHYGKQDLISRTACGGERVCLPQCISLGDSFFFLQSPGGHLHTMDG